MRIRRMMALASLALAAAACKAGEGGAAPQVGKPAPAYAATGLAGDSVSLAGLRGRAVLLNVWATWCHPCREELPDLERLHRELGPRGLSVVGVSVDENGTTGGEVREFAGRYGVTYALWRDPDERISTLYRTIGVPSTFLIGPDGTLLWKHLGPVKADNPELRKALAEALGR